MYITEFLNAVNKFCVSYQCLSIVSVFQKSFHGNHFKCQTMVVSFMWPPSSSHDSSAAVAAGSVKRTRTRTVGWSFVFFSEQSEICNWKEILKEITISSIGIIN